MNVVTIDVESLYGVGANALLQDVPVYVQKVKQLAGEGNSVTLTGKGPVWLYLILAHELHGKVTRLRYCSPVSGVVPIFDHSPFAKGVE